MVADNGKPRRRKLSEEERALWGKVTRSVAPLKRMRKQGDRPDSKQPEPAAKPIPVARPGPIAVRKVSPVAALAPRPAPLDRRLKQRLARGTESIDARLDLHGRTQSESHAALIRFLRNAQADGAKVVLVVTGKGSGRAGEVSNERGVLKRQVPLWLSLPEFSPYVVGFGEAQIGHGGSGALYVRVRRRRTSD